MGIPLDTPIGPGGAGGLCRQGIGGKKNMKLIEDLASAGAAIGSSRPVAETLKYVP